jgi:hypothetical protein
MIKIFLELNGLDVVGWGMQMNNAPSLEINENDDFFSNFTNYQYVDGKLVLKA